MTVDVDFHLNMLYVGVYTCVNGKRINIYVTVHSYYWSPFNFFWPPAKDVNVNFCTGFIDVSVFYKTKLRYQRHKGWLVGRRSTIHVKRPTLLCLIHIVCEQDGNAPNFVSHLLSVINLLIIQCDNRILQKKG